VIPSAKYADCFIAMLLALTSLLLFNNTPT